MTGQHITPPKARALSVVASVFIAALSAATPATGQGVRKPMPLPGIDPGGVMVALVGVGIDYTRPDLAARLARDGEGEIIGFDLVDRDRRPYCSGGCQPETEAALALLAAAPQSRLAIFKVNGVQLAAPAVQMAVQAKAAVIVLDLPDDAQTATLLRQASERFRDTLIVLAPRSGPKSLADGDTAPKSAAAGSSATPPGAPELALEKPQGSPPIGPAPSVPASNVPAPSVPASNVPVSNGVSPGAKASPTAPSNPQAPIIQDVTGPVSSLPTPPPPSPARLEPARPDTVIVVNASGDEPSNATQTGVAPPNSLADPSSTSTGNAATTPTNTNLERAMKIAAEAARIVSASPSTRGTALKAQLEAMTK